MSIVNAPRDEGVKSNEYALPLPVKLLLIPFVTVISEIVKPNTGSLNETVIGIGETLVGLAMPDVIDNVGGILSIV